MLVFPCSFVYLVCHFNKIKIIKIVYRAVDFVSLPMYLSESQTLWLSVLFPSLHRRTESQRHILKYSAQQADAGPHMRVPPFTVASISTSARSFLD